MALPRLGALLLSTLLAGGATGTVTSEVVDLPGLHDDEGLGGRGHRVLFAAVTHVLAGPRRRARLRRMSYAAFLPMIAFATAALAAAAFYFAYGYRPYRRRPHAP